MDIKDNPKELIQLRMEMVKKLAEFEEKTGLKIEGITLIRANRLRERDILADVEIEMKL